MTNILQVQDDLKGLPDQALMQEMQAPSGLAPQFLVMTELQRRKTMRQNYANRAQDNGQTVANDLMKGIMTQAPAQPQTPPVPGSAPQAAQVGPQAPVQGYAEGGRVGRHRPSPAGPEQGLYGAEEFGWQDVGEGLSQLGTVAQDVVVAPVAIAEQFRDWLMGRDQPFDDRDTTNRLDAEVMRREITNARHRKFLEEFRPPQQQAAKYAEGGEIYGASSAPGYMGITDLHDFDRRIRPHEGGRAGYNASNDDSHAIGMRQFLPSTWNSLVKKYPNAGLRRVPSDIRPGHEAWPSAEEQDKAYLLYLGDVQKGIASQGYNPNNTNTYAGWFFGPDAAPKMLRAYERDPNRSMSETIRDVFGDKKAEKVISQNNIKPQMTTAQFFRSLEREFGDHAADRSRRQTDGSMMERPQAVNDYLGRVREPNAPQEPLPGYTSIRSGPGSSFDRPESSNFVTAYAPMSNSDMAHTRAGLDYAAGPETPPTVYPQRPDKGIFQYYEPDPWWSPVGTAHGGDSKPPPAVTLRNTPPPGFQPGTLKAMAPQQSQSIGSYLEDNNPLTYGANLVRNQAQSLRDFTLNPGGTGGLGGFLQRIPEGISQADSGRVSNFARGLASPVLGPPSAVSPSALPAQMPSMTPQPDTVPGGGIMTMAPMATAAAAPVAAGVAGYQALRDRMRSSAPVATQDPSAITQTDNPGQPSYSDILAKVQGQQPGSDDVMQQYIDEIRGGHQNDRAMALAQAGLSMASGTSPYFATNVGQGGLAGLKSYQDSGEQRNAETMRLMQMRQQQQAQQSEIEARQQGTAANIYGTDTSRYIADREMNQRVQVAEIQAKARVDSVIQRSGMRGLDGRSYADIVKSAQSIWNNPAYADDKERAMAVDTFVQNAIVNASRLGIRPADPYGQQQDQSGVVEGLSD